MAQQSGVADEIDMRAFIQVVGPPEVLKQAVQLAGLPEAVKQVVPAASVEDLLANMTPEQRAELKQRLQ